MSSSSNLIIFFIQFLQLKLSAIHSTTQNYQQYEFQLGVQAEHLCPSPDYMCANGQPHFLCQVSINISRPQTFQLCASYKYIHLTNEWKRIFIAGHNGIRNKVAVDWGIANMNLVHWSRELETMAMFYLQTCQIDNDHCLVIGEDMLKVKQNYCLRRRLSKRWPGRVVRSWYLEIGYNVNSVREYLQQHRQKPIANFSQMIWPPLEFVGCGAAHIQFSFYLIVCYYHPPYDDQNLTQEFDVGVPCTKCKKTRNVCSLEFLGLCGIDVDMSRTSSYFQYNLFCIIFLLICLYCA